MFQKPQVVLLSSALIRESEAWFSQQSAAKTESRKAPGWSTKAH
jgi:hypothetical protein